MPETTTKPDLSWMSTFCLGNESGNREIIKAPLRIERDGKASAFASDGKLAIVIDGDNNFPVPTLPKTQKNLDAILGITFERVGSSTVEAISEWAGAYEDSKEGRCPNCGGDGQCDSCSCEKPHDCGVCGGSGEVEESADHRHGYIVGMPVDRNLTAKAMCRVSGPCEIMVNKNKNKDDATILKFVGSGWTIFQAGLADMTKGTEGPELKLIGEDANAK